MTQATSARPFTDLDRRQIAGAPVAEACPFCGADPKHVYVSPSLELFDPAAVERDDAETFTAECGECGVRGAPAMSPLEAAQAWNRRRDSGLRGYQEPSSAEQASASDDVELMRMAAARLSPRG